MSDSPAPLTPEQEARIKELVRAMLPEIIQAMSAALLAGLEKTDQSGQ